MRKIMICLMCIVMLAYPASAQLDEPRIDSNTYVLSLSGTSTTKSGNISLVVTKGDILNTITESNLDATTVFVYELETNANGEWSGQIQLPTPQAESDYGWYYVYVNGETNKNFYLAKPTEIDDAVAAVCGASASTLGSVLYEWTVTKPILPLDLGGDYVKFTGIDATFTHSAMLSFLGQCQNPTGNDVTASLGKALEVARYSYGDKTDIVKALTDNLLTISYDATPGLDSIAEKYVSLRTTPTYDTTVITKNIRSAVALLKVNAATKGEMTTIFADYNDVLLLELTGDYAALDQVEVNKKLLNKNFGSIPQLQEAFRVAVQEVKDGIVDDEEEIGEGDNIIQIEKDTGGGGGGGGTVTKPNKEKEEIVTPPVEETPSLTKGSFDDLKEAPWAEEYIDELYKKGIINGVAERIFAPTQVVKREEFVKMLMGAFGISPTDTKTHFVDVDNGAWYEGYIGWAVENGIIQGIDNQNFGVGQSLTREQMAAISVRMMEKMGIKLDAGEIGFSDVNDISQYAENDVRKICSANIIDGMPDGSFMPKSSLTRAQAAKVICLVMKVGGLSE